MEKKIRVTLHGQLDSEPQKLVQELMTTLAQKLQFKIEEGHENQRKVDRKKESLSATWSWPGKTDPTADANYINMLLLSDAQAREVYDQLQGKAINLGNEVIEIEVSSELCPHGTSAQAKRKNWKGGRA